MRDFGLKMFTVGGFDIGIAGSKELYPTRESFVEAVKDNWKGRFDNSDFSCIRDTRSAFRKVEALEREFPDGCFIITDDDGDDTFPVWAWTMEV